MRTDAVPSFTPSSSPELDSLLARFRDKAFVPEYLDRQYRRIIFKPDADRILTENPIYVNLDPSSEEKYRLQPVRPGDVPSKNKIKDVVRLMKTKDDWYNLLPLLTGLAASRKTLTPEQWEWVVRKAGESGAYDTIVTCATHAKKTHLPLYNRNVARKYFYNLHRQAQNADFRGEGLEKAYKAAKSTAILMQTRIHQAPFRQQVPSSKAPEIIGIVLELSAARALDVTGGRDDAGEVRFYANLVLSNWLLGDFSVPDNWPEVNERLQEFIPLWRGIQLALQIEEIRGDEPASKLLSTRKTELEGKIDRGLGMIRNIDSSAKNRLGVILAEQLYNKEFKS